MEGKNCFSKFSTCLSNIDKGVITALDLGKLVFFPGGMGPLTLERIFQNKRLFVFNFLIVYIINTESK